MDTAISVDLSVHIVYSVYRGSFATVLCNMHHIIIFRKNRRHFQNFSTVGKQGEGQLRDRGGQQRLRRRGEEVKFIYSQKATKF